MNGVLGKGMKRLLLALGLGVVAVACGSSADSISDQVTDTGVESGDDVRTIKIGFSYPDVSDFAVLDDKFSIGDVEEQVRAIVNGWRSTGELAAHGLDVEIVFDDYNILRDDDKFGICNSFAQDEEVFAAVTGRSFTVGAECLANRFGIPTIDYDGTTPAIYDRTPLLFTLRPNEQEVLEAYVDWAEERGLWTDKRIGIMWDLRSEEAADAFVSSVTALGHEVVVNASSDPAGIGSPEDAVTAERFIEAEVDVAVLIVGVPNATNFQAHARDQGYQPTYLAIEWAAQIGDISTASMIQEQIDGSLGMTVSRVGEIAAGFELSDAAQICIDNYVEFSGRDIQANSPETAEWVQILDTCDQMSILHEGLLGMSPDDVSTEAFVSSLESIRDLPVAGWGDVSFSADDHSGVSQFRTIEWQTECLCWTALDAEMTNFVG